MVKSELIFSLAALPVGLLTFKAAVTVAFQNKFIYCGYFPIGSRKHVKRPAFAEQRWIKSQDGTRLEVWLMPNRTRSPQTLPTMLYFQGNAGNLGHRHRHFEKLMGYAGINIIGVHYRGYGHSKGRSSEKGLQMDALALLDYARREVEWCRQSPLIAYGQSLGGAVAIDLVARNPGVFQAMILENTFTSIKDMVYAIYPKWSMYTKLTPFLWNHWPSIDRIAQVDCPTLFLVGRADEIVPSEQGEQLYRNCKQGHLQYFENGMHDTTWLQPGYALTIKDFINRHVGNSVASV